MKCKLKISGHVWLESETGLKIGRGRKMLLEKINECGSIAGAAKAINISYRRAWAMVKEMNRNSEKIIVEKSAGGINGGNARLTGEGKQIISEFNKLENNFEKFKSNN